ncbi:MAG: hypothetical protein CMJ58_08760 [Planctomycetaceae bacterium]|nr:hypothetical protein [Planctomycetaceae bacterium]
MLRRFSLPLALVAAALAATAAPPGALASDHLDAPNLSGVGALDINDLYAFQSPTNANNSVLIMTVNPFVGSLSGSTFDTSTTYEFQIDNTGDAVADLTYAATFAAPVAGVQTGTVTLNGSAYAAGATGATIATSGGGQLTFGVFDDPFFFDLAGFNNGLAFTGDDAFAGANVSAIVLEVPSSELGGPNIGVWARTTDGTNQIDRVGRPAINTVLIPSARKQEFNEAAPAGDFAAFGSDVNSAIAGLSNQPNADALTPILLPDVLTFDTSSSAGFLNGRQLADDVIDAELTLLTGSASPIGDGVDANDVAFRSAFPYLAPANPVPEPAAAALLVCAIAGGWGLRKRRRSLHYGARD